MNSKVKERIRDIVKEKATPYNGDPIDDYMEYHPATAGEPFDKIFGSIVYTMTVIGEEFYFKVKKKDGENEDYEIKMITGDHYGSQD